MKTYDLNRNILQALVLGHIPTRIEQNLRQCNNNL